MSVTAQIVADAAGKRGDLRFHDIPYDIQVHGKVAVNDRFAHVSRIVPGDFGHLAANFSRDVPSGLTDDFDVPYDCVDRFLVSLEFRECQACRVTLDLSANVDDVFEVEVRVTPHEWPHS